jgi:hypothetical protein
MHEISTHNCNNEVYNTLHYLYDIIDYLYILNHQSIE